MNLARLFEMQKALDDRIVREKGLEGQDLLPNKILALQVELGELANEWRGFKVWSNDRKPRTKRYGTCCVCNGTGIYINKQWKDDICSSCRGHGQVETGENPLLEEYVDCLHFILSIGLEFGLTDMQPGYVGTELTSVVDVITGLMTVAGYDFPCGPAENQIFMWHCFMVEFQRLGEMLGFTWHEVEQAYFTKNAENHSRQDRGY